MRCCVEVYWIHSLDGLDCRGGLETDKKVAGLYQRSLYRHTYHTHIYIYIFYLLYNPLSQPWKYMTVYIYLLTTTRRPVDIISLILGDMINDLSHGNN
jgi:hypothetical protein